MGGNLLQALGMLSVTVLILALAYWTSRWIGVHAAPGRTGWPGSMGGDGLRVLARLEVGRGERLLVVRVRERCLLLGVTEHQIALLKEWEGEEADAWLTETPSAEGAFLGVLRDALQKRGDSRSRRK